MVITTLKAPQTTLPLLPGV